MKTKTQIKRKAKRMLSLLLTAMLIISTMVVGISTVSAAANYYYRGTENSWGTTEMTPISGTSLYYYKSNNFTSTNKFKISDGTEWTTSNNYGGNNVKDNSEIVISNLSDDSNNASISAQSSEYYIIFDSEDKKMYATFSLPIEPTEPTTATDSSAETTQPVTGEYYFWYSTNDNIGQYSGNWKAVPMTKNGSSYYVSNLPVNFGSNFYFIVNKNADIPYRNTVWKTQNDVKVDCSTCSGNFSSNGPQERYVPKESDPTQSEPVYFYRISVKTYGLYSFAFNGGKSVTVTEGSIQPTEPTETVTITVPTVDNATVTAVANNSTTYNEGASFKIEVGSSFTVNVAGENGYTLNKITYGTQSKTETSANFTAESGATTFSVAMDQPVPDTVTINVPTVDNATVKVTAGGREYTSGTFDIQVGSSFTVNVTPAKGYKVGNISYNDADYNNGEAITAVKDVTDIAVTVAVDTVNVDFTKLNNATINVSYTNDKATSATAEITADTTLAMQKDTEFTVTVTPITDYELKSIAYGTDTSSKSPAKFTASADGAVTVSVEQTTPVVEKVTVTVPFVENASVAVEYTNDKGAKTTTTITDANADIVMKKDTDFTVTLNVNSGYKYDEITMTYASSSKIVNPATFTASTNGTLTITADISQTLTGEATIKFKSARSYMYKVSMSVNGAAATEMTRPDKASTSNDDNFGTSYTGTLTFCWYTQKITVTNGETTTLSFKTSGTKLNAKVSAKLEAGKTYYFAVDDIAPSSNTEVTAVELPSGNTKSDQMARNYFHSARHLIYNGTAEDSVLGFTNINNEKYMIGELLNDSNSADALSVMSATAVQKSVASVEEYSDLQNTLLDANMNGKLDVKDATLIQKAVVGLV